jgi:hypothetical protein
MAVGDSYKEIGLRTLIAVGRPATLDQAGVDALTFIDWGGVVSIPERGDEVEDITEPTLLDGRTEHFPGLQDGGALPIPFKYIEGDPGQAVIIPARASNATYTVQEIDIDGVATYYYGRIGSVKRRESSTSTNKGYIATFMVNSDRVELAPNTPVVP